MHIHTHTHIQGIRKRLRVRQSDDRDVDERSSMCVAIVNAVASKVRDLKELARSGSDFAKRQLSYIAGLITTEADRNDRATSNKARLTSMRRSSLSKAVADHIGGVPLTMRHSKATRIDAVDQQDIIESLWHEITDEKKV
jgi:hypothetical protein